MALGSLLARDLGGVPVLAHVYPTAFDYPSMAHVDVEWVGYLQQESAEILAEASERFRLRFGWDHVETASTGHRSSGRGLINLAEERAAAPSSSSARRPHRGGTFRHRLNRRQKLLHDSPVPVALAPVWLNRASAWRPWSSSRRLPEHDGVTGHADLGRRVRRAVTGSASHPHLLIRHRMFGSNLGADAEEMVLRQFEQDSRAAHSEALAEVTISVPTDSVTPTGDSVRSAMERVDWEATSCCCSVQRRRTVTAGVSGRHDVQVGARHAVPAVVLPRRT